MPPGQYAKLQELEQELKEIGDCSPTSKKGKRKQAIEEEIAQLKAKLPEVDLELAKENYRKNLSC